MGNIVLLDDLTINKIAAGEVIERPANVVKELVENSIDAGATSITVEIENGGISYIRITDNGKGIAKDDISLAFERHATSKIRKAEDLTKVSTMGFRGEALASIAAVAKVEMVTKTREEEIGTKVFVEAGNILDEEECGAPIGTTITIRDLFFNTPVRYKFLKKDFTEGGYIEDAVSRIALIHPFISFKMINNKKTILQTNGNGDMQSVVYSVYGKDIASNLVEVGFIYEGIKVTGVAGKPDIARSNRSNQLFYVNGRFIKDKILSSAAEEAYRTLIPNGKFCFCILNIKLNPELVDVNVHPAKLEVRFSEEGKVFKAVSIALKNALLKQDITMQDKIEEEKNLMNGNLKNNIDKNSKNNINYNGDNSIKNNIKDNFENMTSNDGKSKEKKGLFDIFRPKVSENIQNENLRLSEDKSSRGTSKSNVINVNFNSENESTNSLDNEILTSKHLNQEDEIAKDIENLNQENKIAEDIENLNQENKITEDREHLNQENKITEDIENLNQENKIAEDIETYNPKKQNNIFENIEDIGETSKVPDYKIIGSAFSTYILLQLDDEIYILDQHAAHERVLYEKVKKNFYKDGGKDVQMLLMPDILELSRKDMRTVTSHLKLFEQAGFVIEEFGENTIKIMGVPVVCYEMNTKDLFADILDGIDITNRTTTQDVEEKFLSTVACKAAVKANMGLDESEIKALLDELLLLENPFTCPHGRPTAIRITKNEIEKKFGRK